MCCFSTFFASWEFYKHRKPYLKGGYFHSSCVWNDAVATCMVLRCALAMRRVSCAALHDPRIHCRRKLSYVRLLRRVPRLAPPMVASSLGQSPLASRSLSSTSGSDSDGSPTSTSTFPPPTEAASVPFPGTGLRVSRVGFGSPWMGAGPDRGLDLSRYIFADFCLVGRLLL